MLAQTNGIWPERNYVRRRDYLSCASGRAPPPGWHATNLQNCSRIWQGAQYNMVPECRCIHKDGPLNLKQQEARLEIRRNFFSSSVVDAWKMVPSTKPRTVLQWHIENTERTWWKMPKMDQRRRQASGGTTSGTGHFLRDPTWVTGRRPSSIGTVLSIPCAPPEQRLGRHDDERLPERQRNLPPQDVEIVGRSWAICNWKQMNINYNREDKEQIVLQR